MAQPAISRIERDETHDPGLLLAVALARALGVTLDHLVEGAPSTRAKRISLEQRVTALEHAVADTSGAFGQRYRRYVLNQSKVRCHASFAAASSYRGVVSLWKP